METGTNNASSTLADARALYAAADRCVACGLCLKDCPTYAVTRNEANGPRGRVMLMAALADNRLPPGGTLSSHLEQCLHCGNCERVCPANVAYNEMIDHAKALLRRRRALRPLPWWFNRLLRDAGARKLLGWLVGAWQRSGAQAAARKHRLIEWGGLGAFESMLPRALVRRPAPVQAAPKGEVRLFTGCVAELSERPTTAAMRHLLNACGYAVKTPARQHCCGAMHRHNGELEAARRCMRRNLAAFGDATIITAATGCGAHWRQFGPSARHCDIHDFLARDANLAALQFEPLDAVVALHIPCTARDALVRADAPVRLLQRIPGLKLRLLQDDSGCCGAGGAHILRRFASGDKLLQDKIKALQQSGADMLLTLNTGCAMHWRRGLHAQNIAIPVIHPAVLLYLQHKRASTRR